MERPHSPRPRFNRSPPSPAQLPGLPLRLFLPAALLLPLALGCASPGPPRPPSLHIPETVRDLHAERIGDAVTLHWTTPSETTDHQPIREGLSAEICTEVLRTPPPPPPKPAPKSPPDGNSAATAATASGGHTPRTLAPASTGALGASPPASTLPASPDPGGLAAAGKSSAGGAPTHPPCSPALVLATHTGAASATLPLSPSLLTGPPVLVAYRLFLRSGRSGRIGDPSSPAYAPTGPAPATVANLRATPAARGLRLTWQPDPAPGALVELARTTAGPKPTPLRLADPTPGDAAGGLLDTSAKRGETYTYTALRLLRTSVLGVPVVLKSTPSATANAHFVDLDPPSAPTGVLAIPTPTSTDLSWQPNTEPDLAGYLVFRAPASAAAAGQHSTDLSAPPWARLTPDPVPAPAFRDRAAPSGDVLYVVVAVDQSGNRSAPSEPVRVTSASH